MIRLLVIAAAVVGLSSQAHAADIKTITARVVGVHDGDTLTALTDDKRPGKLRYLQRGLHTSFPTTPKNSHERLH
jgi:endonuclease YncB( thermonuclease family)